MEPKRNYISWNMEVGRTPKGSMKTLSFLLWGAAVASALRWPRTVYFLQEFSNCLIWSTGKAISFFYRDNINKFVSCLSFWRTCYHHIGGDDSTDKSPRDKYTHQWSAIWNETLLSGKCILLKTEKLHQIEDNLFISFKNDNQPFCKVNYLSVRVMILADVEVRAIPWLGRAGRLPY